MNKEEHARLLDTLRKRRSRRREKALREELPEDTYIGPEDFIEFYEHQDTRRAAPARHVEKDTRPARQDTEHELETTPERTGFPWGRVIVWGVIVLLVLLFLLYTRLYPPVTTEESEQP